MFLPCNAPHITYQVELEPFCYSTIVTLTYLKADNSSNVDM